MKSSGGCCCGEGKEEEEEEGVYGGVVEATKAAVGRDPPPIIQTHRAHVDSAGTVTSQPHRSDIAATSQRRRSASSRSARAPLSLPPSLLPSLPPFSSHRQLPLIGAVYLINRQRAPFATFRAARGRGRRLMLQDFTRRCSFQINIWIYKLVFNDCIVLI